MGTPSDRFQGGLSEECAGSGDEQKLRWRNSFACWFFVEVDKKGVNGGERTDVRVQRPGCENWLQDAREGERMRRRQGKARAEAAVCGHGTSR